MNGYKLSTSIQQQIWLAITDFETTAKLLIDKLITETTQPEKDKIAQGLYYEIQNAMLRNGEDNLSDNWYFDVHGEHCFFINTKNNQELEVHLGDIENTANLDPQFFYNFLKTTGKFKHLTKFFENPFQDMLAYFDRQVAEGKMIHVGGVNFRKI